MIILLTPVVGPITQNWSPKHPAIDIACLPNTPILAAHDGKGKASYDVQMGNVMELYGDNGLITMYAHLSSTRGNLTYQRGDVIGYCGDTGQWSSGPHLHFQSNQPYTLTNEKKENTMETVGKVIGGEIR